MGLFAGRLWVFVVGMSAVLGCSEVSNPSGTVEVRFAIKENFEQTPLEGAEICETGTTRCATTDSNGGAKLALPANRRLSYTIENEDYESILLPVLTGTAGGDVSHSMYTEEWLADNFANLDSPYPMTDRGMIHVIFSPRFAGATFELVDATGKAFYKDEEDSWSANLEATTAGGTGRERCCAEGGFVEVVPGEHQVEIGGTAQDCAPESTGGLARSWPGDAPNRFRAPVRAGFSTRIILLCPPSL